MKVGIYIKEGKENLPVLSGGICAKYMWLWCRYDKHIVHAEGWEVMAVKLSQAF